MAHYHEHCSFELQISDHIQDVNVTKDKSSTEESLPSCYFTFPKPDSMSSERFLEWNREVTTKEWAFQFVSDYNKGIFLQQRGF